MVVEVGEKVNQLVRALSLPEKVALCIGADFWHTQAFDQHGIPAIRVVDGPHGVRYVGNELRAIDSRPATAFPTGSALAATWNQALIRQVGAALGAETQAQGCHVLLGPAVNIQRSPLCGRNFEYFSEDPWLSARLAAAYIEGLQSQGVGACVKHFLCNNSEFERLTLNSEVDERALREIYLPAFESAVTEARAWSLMCSYNKVNGTSLSESQEFLSAVLKTEWGFDGPVISDWYAVYDRLASAQVGLDLEMPGGKAAARQELFEAVTRGEVPEQALDERARRILTLVLRASDRQPSAASAAADFSQRGQAELARLAAGEAIVLLKNSNGQLPLEASAIRSIALIGPLAKDPVIQGHGSARVNPHYAVSVLQSLTERCGDRISIRYQPGCSADGSLPGLTAEHVYADEALTERGFNCEYFGQPTLGGAPVHCFRPQEIRLSKGAPIPGQLANVDFSARWTGYFVPPTTGEYVFGLTNNGLGRLAVDDQVLIDQGVGRAVPSTQYEAAATGAIQLTAGTPYRLCIHYQRNCEHNYSFRVGCRLPGSVDEMASAAAAAAEAEVAVVCVGLADGRETEGRDRPNLNLTGQQEALIQQIAQANRNTVVVVVSGAPVDMSRWIGQVGAVIQAWYTGQEQGHAIVDVLLGQVNPSGKLPVTFPVSLQETPAFLNYPGENGTVRYGEGIFVGYRYYDAKRMAPLFPFGHGLSYTTFDYSTLEVEVKELADTLAVQVSLRVTNTGARAGSDVVQLYVHDSVSSLVRPPKELKGFEKIQLAPGEAREVGFSLSPRELAYYDPRQKAWIAEPGEFEVQIGSSAQDIRQRARFRITAGYRLAAAYDARWSSFTPGLDADVSLRDLLAWPESRAVLMRELQQVADYSKLFWLRDYSLNQIAAIDRHLIPADVRRNILEGLKALPAQRPTQ